MTEEQDTILKDFTEYEKARGLRSLRKIKYLLQIYFRYLEESENSIYVIKHRDAQNFQTWLTTLTDNNGKVLYCSTYIHEIIWCCKNFYHYLRIKKQISGNPFDNIRTIKQEKKVLRDIPDEKRLNEFLKKMKCFWQVKGLRNKRYTYKIHVISELMYSTGLRIDEVALLTADDIDFDRGMIRVRKGKGGMERTCYLNEYAGKVLRVFIEQMKEIVNEKKDSFTIFGSKNGKCLERSVNKWLKDNGKQFGFNKFTSHNFRHSLGYHLLRSGCDLRYIQLILGHNTLGSTTIYTKVNKNDLKSELDKYHPRRFKEQRE